MNESLYLQITSPKMPLEVLETLPFEPPSGEVTFYLKKIDSREGNQHLQECLEQRALPFFGVSFSYDPQRKFFFPELLNINTNFETNAHWGYSPVSSPPKDLKPEMIDLILHAQAVPNIRVEINKHAFPPFRDHLLKRIMNNYSLEKAELTIHQYEYDGNYSIESKLILSKRHLNIRANDRIPEEIRSWFGRFKDKYPA